ncbi:MAG: 3-hydroxybutyryl-CoA dehydrogenase [Betaproteobacteria bacterium]|nr:3-hydroxybutyryl-CoA dehydrogenase [Betaproteobacteria bacterium]
MLDVSRADLIAGVAGSGTMGRGIVQVLAQCGLRTLVFDAQPGSAQRAKLALGETLGKLVERGKLERTAAGATLARIEIVDSLEAFAPCHLVVEAIVEDLGAKRELFSKLEAVVVAECILASNTSSLSVTAMAAACKRPQRVAGYHFFNPVPVMKIVEVVAGELTEPRVIEALSLLARRFGHTPVRCKDTPGFVVNHAGRAYVPEALRILSEGVADFATMRASSLPSSSFSSGTAQTVSGFAFPGRGESGKGCAVPSLL